VPALKRVAVFLFALGALYGQKNGTLTFSDEFGGRELDLSKWSIHDPAERVRDGKIPELAGVSNGFLHASGVLSTYGIFAQAFGRFEIRCKLSGGKSSFRLMPLPLAPLPMIEVFSASAASPTQVSFGNYWGTEQTRRAYGDAFPAPNLSTGFHVITLDWQPDHISWLLDGKEKFRSDEGIPQQSMYLLLDITGDIDYIRVYGP
jgi:beta-glucanase (GH16 family)